MFGRSSEKGKCFDGEHLMLFNEAEMVAEPSVPEPENGADASARCYIIIESGNLNGLNVFGYLSYLLTERPKLGNEPTDGQLDGLMPWSESLPDRQD